MNQSLAFAITTTAISGLLLFCWIMEMRTIRKLRDGHREECRRLREEHKTEVAALRHQADIDIERIKDRERSEGWEEGRQYQLKQMTRKRDKAGRFA